MPRPIGVTAYAGTEIVQDYTAWVSHSVPMHRCFTAIAFFTLRYRWFRLSSIDQYSQLLPHIVSGPCLSSGGTVHSFEPVRREWLGELLPHQQPDTYMAYLSAYIDLTIYVLSWTKCDQIEMMSHY